MTEVISTEQRPFSEYTNTIHNKPTFSTFDPTSPVLKSRELPIATPMYGQGPKPVGSRYETVPHQGAGTAQYVRQPSTSTLKAGNGLFASAHRIYYYPDPERKPFIDVDGNACGPRWIMVDPRGNEEAKSGGGCVVM